MVLTAESAHRTYLLEETPAAFRKIFTLGQFADVGAVVRRRPGRSPRARAAARAQPATARRRPPPDVDRPLPPRARGQPRLRRAHRRPARYRRARTPTKLRRVSRLHPAPPSPCTPKASMDDVLTTTFFAILAAGFFVGAVVGLTGMGGGALMTPALIFLGVGDAATVVTADLTAAAVYKTGGAIVHKREGSPNMQLAKWLIIGSVPMALLGPHLVNCDRSSRRARPGAQAVHRLRAAPRRADLRRCGSTSTCAACGPAPTSRTTTRRSGRSRPCSSAPSAACSSASPASAPARSS